MEYRVVARLLLVAAASLTFGCDLLEPPNPGTEVDLELSYENGDCIVITFTPTLPEETEAVVFDFGDGTLFEGEAPPPHAYCHQGSYEMAMTASGPGWSSTYTDLLTLFPPRLPAPDVLLGMGSEGTELHTVNLFRTSFQRRYTAQGRAFAVTHSAAGERGSFDGELAIEITPPSGGANGADPAPAPHPLTRDDSGLYRADLGGYVHATTPPWLVDEEPMATSPAVFPTVNMGQYDIDLPLRVQEVPALDAPLTLRLFRGTNGGVSGIRYVLRRLEQTWAFDAPPGSASVTLSVEQLAAIGPGLLEIWAVTYTRLPAPDNDDVLFVTSFVEGKTIILAPGGDPGNGDAGVPDSDAGLLPVDAGSVADDAGPPDDDGGAPHVMDAGGADDAGAHDDDAGMSELDAGASGHDAGGDGG